MRCRCLRGAALGYCAGGTGVAGEVGYCVGGKGQAYRTRRVRGIGEGVGGLVAGVDNHYRCGASDVGVIKVSHRLGEGNLHACRFINRGLAQGGEGSNRRRGYINSNRTVGSALAAKRIGAITDGKQHVNGIIRQGTVGNLRRDHRVGRGVIIANAFFHRGRPPGDGHLWDWVVSQCLIDREGQCQLVAVFGVGYAIYRRAIATERGSCGKGKGKGAGCAHCRGGSGVAGGVHYTTGGKGQAEGCLGRREGDGIGDFGAAVEGYANRRGALGGEVGAIKVHRFGEGDGVRLRRVQHTQGGDGIVKGHGRRGGIQRYCQRGDSRHGAIDGLADA